MVPGGGKDFTTFDVQILTVGGMCGSERGKGIDKKAGEKAEWMKEYRMKNEREGWDRPVPALRGPHRADTPFHAKSI
jgi:hypothetical protein